MVILKGDKMGVNQTIIRQASVYIDSWDWREVSKRRLGARERHTHAYPYIHTPRIHNRHPIPVTSRLQWHRPKTHMQTQTYIKMNHRNITTVKQWRQEILRKCFPLPHVTSLFSIIWLGALKITEQLLWSKHKGKVLVSKVKAIDILSGL